MLMLGPQSFGHSQMSDFAFLDERHILVGFRSMSPYRPALDRAESSIRIYVFADQTGQPSPVDNACIGSLGLPCIHHSASISEVIFHSNPLPSDHSLVPGGAPFLTSRQDRIFLVELVIETQENVDPQALLCIPQRILKAQALAMAASAGTLHVPWAAWGPKGSRFFFGHPFDGRWACPGHGSRFITSQMRVAHDARDGRGPYDALEIRVYDFGGMAVQKGLAATELSDPWTYEDGPEDVHFHRFPRLFHHDVTQHFEDDLSTRLPFRWTSKVWEQPLEGNGAPIGVMLSEDNIMVVLEEVCLSLWLGRHVCSRHLSLMVFMSYS